MKNIIIFCFMVSVVMGYRDLLIPLPPYNWGKYMNIPVPDNSGNQIFRFKTKNKHYLKNSTAKKFVEKNFKNAKKFDTDTDLLRYACSNLKIKDGFILEMGVATGKSINFIAALNPKNTIYGFDSFEGLPVEWDRADSAFHQGVFSFKNPIPEIPVLKNVTLFKGWFKDTLPRFQFQIMQNRPISLLHVDCDIYSSTKDVFNFLGENIVPGTIIVFDEFYNYDNFENHEYKAFMEYINHSKKRFKYIGFNTHHEQVVVQITG